MTVELGKAAEVISQSTPAADLVGRDVGHTKFKQLDVSDDSLISILVVTSSHKTFCEFAEICKGPHWDVHWAQSVKDARDAAMEHAFSAIVCQARVADGIWTNILDVSEELPELPLVVVICDLNDDRNWMEAINHGAYDVISRPFHPADVMHVMKMAWYAFQRKHVSRKAGLVGRCVGR